MTQKVKTVTMKLQQTKATEVTQMGQVNNTIKKERWKQLSELERYKIEALLRVGLNPRDISKQLGRNRRTIEREIAKGTVEQLDSELRTQNVYCADVGQRVHLERGANKGRTLKIGNDHELATYIEDKIIKEKMSPDAIIGEIRVKNIEFKTSICTKTVYNYIDKNVFLNVTNTDLPVKKNKKKRKHRKTRPVALNNLKGKSIEERPEAIESRIDLGHWEMDCVVGKGKACLLVMTERKSRLELIFKMKAKTQENVVRIVDKLERKYKKQFKQLFKSITMDNGSEFLDSISLEKSCLKVNDFRTNCYYAHPYSSWERGSNEVANKLIRRFVPKGSDISKLTLKEVKRIQYWMNNYPRKIFGYRTANDIYAV